MNTSTFGTSSNSPSEAREQREGRVARAIEKRTARLPSDIFLWAAGASILGSLVIQGLGLRGPVRGMRVRMMGSPLANFVGQWAPTFLLLGLYNKIVKVAGSDRDDYEG